MAQQVEVIVTDLGRQADPFILHLYAALASQPTSCSQGLNVDLARWPYPFSSVGHLVNRLQWPR
jgi:hypothetical protein